MTVANYCVYVSHYPFIDNQGKLHLCCKNKWHETDYNILTHTIKEMYFSPEMIDVRNQILNGVMPHHCEVCYDVERSGNPKSFRNRSLRHLREIIDGKNGDEPFLGEKIRALDLRLGSTCNLTCIMCHPSDSNRWHQIYPNYAKNVLEKKESHITWAQDVYNPKKQNWAEYDQAWENIFCDIDNDLRKIYLAGGEPFYLKKFPEYIEELVNRAPQAHVEINTNATRLLPMQYIEKIKHADINLRVSIDGFGQADEYTRQGTAWEEKISIIKTYSKYFKIPFFDVTINSLNLQSIPKLVEWIEENFSDSRILLRPVVNRKGLEIESIPISMREELANFLYQRTDNSKYHNVKQIMDLCRAETIDRRKEQQLQVDFWNNHGSIKLSDFNPELEEWIFGNYSS